FFFLYCISRIPDGQKARLGNTQHNSTTTDTKHLFSLLIFLFLFFGLVFWPCYINTIYRLPSNIVQHQPIQTFRRNTDDWISRRLRSEREIRDSFASRQG